MYVLYVRPGNTDPASIKFRNENELMEKAADPEDYYIHVIMQEKIKLYLVSVQKRIWWFEKEDVTLSPVILNVSKMYSDKE